MDNAWAGIDAGKEFHWARVVGIEGETLLSRKVENDEADLRKLIGEVLPLAEEITWATDQPGGTARSEEHTSELQSRVDLVCRLLLEKTKSRASRPRRRERWRSRPRIRLRGSSPPLARSSSFFFNDTATTEIYTLSLHDALPI